MPSLIQRKDVVLRPDLWQSRDDFVRAARQTRDNKQVATIKLKRRKGIFASVLLVPFCG